MSSYLIPVLLVCIIGIVAGVILTIAAKLMFVPVDERVSACTDALPGANCGGCGYAGCSDYAVAIVENGAELNKCPVGGAAVAEALGAVMGVSVEAGEAHYALVKCGGYADKSQKILEYKGIPSCKAVKSMYNGDNACAYGCLGQGDCVKACNFNAIGIVNGVAWVDRAHAIRALLQERHALLAVSVVRSAKRLVSLMLFMLLIIMRSSTQKSARTAACALRNALQELS